MSLFDQIFNEVITPYFEPRIKRSSIKAVKGYVQGVEVARKIALTSYGLGAAAAVAVTGLILMLVAVVGLLPIDPRAALFSLLALGAVLTVSAVLFAYRGLNQKRWLEMSKSNEMIEAVLKPWPTAYSIPDPRVILRGSPPAVFDADQNFELNRKLETSSANRMPADAAHDAIHSHVPNATYPSMTTPESSIATRSMDTTSSLRP